MPLTEDPNTPFPVVLVLKPGSVSHENALEGRFATQTALALTQFRVVSIVEGLGDFFALTESARHEIIRNITEQQHAAATLWVEETEKNTVLLHVMAFSTGQAFIRIVEAPNGGDAPLVLSLAAQEMLAQIISEDPLAQAGTDAAVPTSAAVVKPEGPAGDNPPADATAQTQPNAGPTEPQSQPVRRAPPNATAHKADGNRRRMPLALSVFIAGEGGLAAAQGASLMLGGGVAFEGFPQEKIAIRITGLILSGLKEEADWGTITHFGAQAGAAAGYLTRFGSLSLGPIVDVTALWRRTTIDLETTGTHRFSWWSLRLSAACSLRWAFHARFFAAIEPRLGVWPIARRFYLDPDGESIFRSPRVDWGVTLGMGMRF